MGINLLLHCYSLYEVKEIRQMKIKSLQIKNFRRFTDITLQDISQETRLVLIIGSNGSGKSSIFDAFEFLSSQNGKSWRNFQLDYRKDPLAQEVVKIDTYDYGEEGLFNGGWNRTNKLNTYSFYGRTSFRQVPRLTRTSLGNRSNLQNDEDRAYSFIDREERFENDLEYLFGKLLKEFFKTDNDKSQIKRDVIDPINESLARIFGNQNGTKLELLELIPPLEGKIAEVTFKKGESTFQYNYLSAGEKEVFNILINLVARKEFYTNTIYFFDEIDLHLNTRLQFNFLKEVVEKWIPEACQFWTASHSLGFIDFAKQSSQSVIFDFDDYDFDRPRVLVPVPKDNPDIYQIAVDKEFLPQLFKGLTVVFVENSDKVIYGSIGIQNTVFIPENGRNGVYHKVKGGNFKGIVDRDFLSDEDIKLIEDNYKSLRILRYYSIENYIFHPDNLEDYYSIIGKEFHKEIYIGELAEEKKRVKDDIIPSLSLKRTEYPYFGEPEFNGKSLQNRFKNKQENILESSKIAAYLNSEKLEIFYSVFPMKTYATQLGYRKNLSRTDLIKTVWFKSQMEKLLLY